MAVRLSETDFEGGNDPALGSRGFAAPLAAWRQFTLQGDFERSSGRCAVYACRFAWRREGEGLGAKEYCLYVNAV